jgi:hypothetical protein
MGYVYMYMHVHVHVYVPLAVEDIDVLAGLLPLKVRVLGNRLEVQMVKLKRLNLL